MVALNQLIDELGVCNLAWSSHIFDHAQRTMSRTTEDLNAISTVHEEPHGPHSDNGEWVDLLPHSREPVRDPVAIRGAGNVTVYVPKN